MDCPKGKFVDHIDGDKLDNRKSNLRICSKAENCWNRTEMNKNNASGYRGVKFDKAKKLWRADIGLNFGKIYLCRSKHVEAAALVYDMAADFYFGKFASLNFKESV
jgi:HNH endonuclease